MMDAMGSGLRTPPCGRKLTRRNLININVLKNILDIKHKKPTAYRYSSLYKSGSAIHKNKW
ncbi:MAG: hypothetical protein AVO38_05305 [delta proteobacterium ML8_D]|nr:MAG: hypothetical protein AVO38_05305 [delta proteobacterium ML8_D]